MEPLFFTKPPDCAELALSAEETLGSYDELGAIKKGCKEEVGFEKGGVIVFWFGSV